MIYYRDNAVMPIMKADDKTSSCADFYTCEAKSLLGFLYSAMSHLYCVFKV